MEKKLKVLAIVGPTASGKTSLSIALAKKLKGEVISADSRQVYRDIDLLSGKVTEVEKEHIPHHLLDVCDPQVTYTADDFVRDAKRAIEDITTRHHLPIIAGGTFFYLDALLEKQSLPSVPPNNILREQLEQHSTAELFTLLQKRDPDRSTTIDSKNRRRLVRALEIIDALGTVPKTIQKNTYDAFTIGITITPEKLHQNIKQRIIDRMNSGMLEEALALRTSGVTHERMEALGLECRYLSRHLEGLLTYEQMIEELETKTRQFAKRQMTWLKRDQSINWIDPKDEHAVSNIIEKINHWLSPT